MKCNFDGKILQNAISSLLLEEKLRLGAKTMFDLITFVIKHKR